MVEDSIVRETEIAAPAGAGVGGADAGRVRRTLVRGGHGRDRPAAGRVIRDDLGRARHGLARVERVEEPALFSFRWALEPGVEPKPGEETLVEFTLTPEGDGTLLTVVESGFSKLDRPAEKQEWHRERNVDGWRQVLEAVAAHSA